MLIGEGGELKLFNLPAVMGQVSLIRWVANNVAGEA